jgi:hypothetical protein
MTRNENLPWTETSVTPQLSEPDMEQFPSNNSDDTIFLNGETTMPQKFDFNSLQAAEKQQSIDDHREYQEVLREIAGDRGTRSRAEILRLLERCDRDTGDLKDDVKWRTERDTKIAELHREEEYRTKNAELLAKLRSLREEFEKVEAEYQEARNPLCWESDALERKLRDIGSYRHDLLDSCRDTNLKIELQILDDSFDHRVEDNLYARQKQVESEIARLKNGLADKQIMPNRHEWHKELKQEINRLQEEWQQLELKKSEIAQKKIEHEKAIDTIREKMIYS